jgi:hypothetical protein
MGEQVSSVSRLVGLKWIVKTTPSRRHEGVVKVFCIHDMYKKA